MTHELDTCLLEREEHNLSFVHSNKNTSSPHTSRRMGATANDCPLGVGVVVVVIVVCVFGIGVFFAMVCVFLGNVWWEVGFS